MKNRKNLFIETQFFSQDQISGLDIPHAIRIPNQNSISTSRNQGEQQSQLTSNYPPQAQSIFIIQRVVSQKLVQNFMYCWYKLKISQQVVISPSLCQSESQFQLPSYFKDQNEVQSSKHMLKIESLKLLQPIQRRQHKTQQSRSGLQWLNEQRQNLKNDQKMLRITDREKQLQVNLNRAKILKDILGKIKQGKQQLHFYNQDIDRKKSDAHINNKLDKIQKFMAGIHHEVYLKHASPTAIIREEPIKQQSRPQDILQINQLQKQLASVKNQISELKKNTQKYVQSYQNVKIEQSYHRSSTYDALMAFQVLKMQMQTLQSQRNLTMVRSQIINSRHTSLQASRSPRNQQIFCQQPLKQGQPMQQPLKQGQPIQQPLKQGQLIKSRISQLQSNIKALSNNQPLFQMNTTVASSEVEPMISPSDKQLSIQYVVNPTEKQVVSSGDNKCFPHFKRIKHMKNSMMWKNRQGNPQTQ